MNSCFQSAQQTTLEHGMAVYNAYLALMANSTEAPVPNWFAENFEWFSSQQVDKSTLKYYLVYHDCAKFKTLSVDLEGNQHFAGHALASKHLWEELFGPSLISELIGRDMDMHLLKPSLIKTYDRPDFMPTLLVCALAELHANAAMFGGFDSTSFKIKFKALTRLGNTFIKTTLKGEKNDH